MSLHSTLLFFANITNSKTGVGSREIFKSEKGFHGRKRLRTTILGVWYFRYLLRHSYQLLLSVRLRHST
jgi:hypothetical protein